MEGFPQRYKSVRMGNVEMTQGNKKAILSAKEWVKNPDHSLWFYGPPGTGKTFIASAAMFEAPIYQPKFTNVAEMLLKFQSGVKEHGEMDLLNEYSGLFCLFDDVGAHRISDFAIEMFGLLLERMYSRCITGLIFTSNLSPKEILSSMGERVASRLRGLAEPIEIAGQDWRLK